MKKIFYVLLMILLSLTVASCSSQTKTEEQPKESVGMPNPIITYDSLDEINNKVGTHIVIPSSIPATDLSYSTINDEIAQVDFMLDGQEWTIRGSKIIDQDISGIYDENNVFNIGENFGLYTNDYYIDRIFVENYQYTTVMANTDNYDTVKFSEYIFTIDNALKRASDPNGIAGEYVDSVSQRATMEISKYEDNYEITVRWPNSSSEEKQWYIVGKLEDKKITYKGEDTAVYKYDKNGDCEVISGTPTTINNVGYFEIKDGKLYWTGAGEDQCKVCIFEKMPF